MSRVQDKVVLITGAATGIGAAAAVRLADEGATVIVTDVNESGGKAVVEQITAAGGTAEFLAHDVAHEDEWIRVTGHVREVYGRIDVLVNNAGIYLIAPLAETTLEDWNRLMAINVTGTFLGLKHVAPGMAEAGGGAIINLSSIAGLMGTAGHTLYGASKGAVRTMSKDVAAEYAAANVRVNSLHPTYVNTSMAAYGAQTAGVSLDDLGPALSPLGRIAETGDVVNFILFLASDEASYLTGSEYTIDGGGSTLLSLG
ncbi:short-chain dehydrogenase [Saccharomonospora sp. CUA-673]|uniref:SDR family NAD(P)-dependent oxidoreductase n=1 Tax=Saccharomonospora sp. CUA-673 TaxID=1904969 RepID=UPI00095DE112|nr:glucose 1-dehydrogenase [Saccharomonospora sp. CUA-673]OLT40050.1 short-chain dehydrogenase [Saccharomonospora sp. CUA-673]